MQEPRVLDVLVCEVLEAEVEPAAVNVAVPTCAVVAVAVAAAVVDVARGADVAVSGEEAEHPRVVVGLSAAQLSGKINKMGFCKQHMMPAFFQVIKSIHTG